MFKKIITFITAIFLTGCTASPEYIELSGKEFKKELISLTNNNKSRKYFWVYKISASLKSKEYLFFQLEYFDLEKKDSVINVVKYIKVKNKEIKLSFDKESSMATREISIENVDLL